MATEALARDFAAGFGFNFVTFVLASSRGHRWQAPVPFGQYNKTSSNYVYVPGPGFSSPGAIKSYLLKET